MSVSIQVRDLRAAIDSRAGGAGTGLPTTSLLAQIFTDTFTSLLSADSALGFRAAIDEIEPTLEDWYRALIDHSYHKLIGPRLQQQQALLHPVSDQVLTLWDATQELCRWLADLLLKIRQGGDEEFSTLEGLRVEHAVSLELREPGWRDAVHLVGMTDAVWHSPIDNRWLVVELKTERSEPEADLAQACLYHLMLQAAGEPATGELSILSFSPELNVTTFTTDQFHDAQRKLIDLAGRLAGVVAETVDHAPNSDEERAVFSRRIEPKHEELGERLLATFREYGVEVEIEPPLIAGPSFLRFPVALGARVRVRAVEQMAKEIQVRLQLEAAPRIGTEGGRVVIDLQRPDRQLIRFSAVRDQLPVPDPLTGSSQAPLGVDIDGQLRLIDFARPEDAHLLVAGSTGSGKSEWLRMAIAGLIETNTPQTLRLLLIDPRGSAFLHLRHSDFLLAPIVSPVNDSVAGILGGLVAEMERRYRSFAEQSVDSLDLWARRTGQSMPRIFCVCDEYADLITSDRESRREIERQITRLGQKARAAGIHLVIATQHPSREIIRGVLDSNIPARIGFRMQKAIESKMLLNVAGAENLLDRGDMLFKDIGDPIRLQAPLLEG